MRKGENSGRLFFTPSAIFGDAPRRLTARLPPVDRPRCLARAKSSRRPSPRPLVFVSASIVSVVSCERRSGRIRGAFTYVSRFKHAYRRGNCLADRIELIVRSPQVIVSSSVLQLPAATPPPSSTRRPPLGSSIFVIDSSRPPARRPRGFRSAARFASEMRLETDRWIFRALLLLSTCIAHANGQQMDIPDKLDPFLELLFETAECEGLFRFLTPSTFLQASPWWPTRSF